MIKVNLGGAHEKLRRLTQKAQEDADRARKKITTEVLGHAIMASPVDTGRFAGNWRVTEGQAASGTTDRLDKTGSAAMAELNAVVGVSAGDSDIFLVNNLPYAGRLEYDHHSPQAPGGMVGPAIAILPQIINAAIRNGGR